MLLSALALPGAAFGAGPDCPSQGHTFVETAGKTVFTSGSARQLRRPARFAVVVRDGVGECRLIQRLLVKRLSKTFPAWKYVIDPRFADLTITYESGFSLCLDECEDRPLPQGAHAELRFEASEVRANWSDETRWRDRSRLVNLFVDSLQRALRDEPA